MSKASSTPCLSGWTCTQSSVPIPASTTWSSLNCLLMSNLTWSCLLGLGPARWAPWARPAPLHVSLDGPVPDHQRRPPLQQHAGQPWLYAPWSLQVLRGGPEGPFPWREENCKGHPKGTNSILESPVFRKNKENRRKKIMEFGKNTGKIQ